MNTNPRLQLQPSRFDRALETAGWITLLSLWAIALYHYSSLPDSIPTHYNIAGRPDRYGKKTSLLLLPLIGTVLFAIITLLNKYPHIFNYPGKITETNASLQYASATRLLRVLKLGILVTFTLIAWKTIATATGQANGIGWWPLVTLICFIVLPTVYFIIKAVQLSK